METANVKLLQQILEILKEARKQTEGKTNAFIKYVKQADKALEELVEENRREEIIAFFSRTTPAAKDIWLIKNISKLL